MSHQLQSFHWNRILFFSSLQSKFHHKIVMKFDIWGTLSPQPSFNRGLYSDQQSGLWPGSPCPLSDQPSEIFELPTNRQKGKQLFQRNKEIQNMIPLELFNNQIGKYFIMVTLRCVCVCVCYKKVKIKSNLSNMVLFWKIYRFLLFLCCFLSSNK